ncbi:MAG: histone deacetylase family protein [Acidimicrobiales bacterium]
MTVLFTTHAQFLDHDTGAGHPERASRLAAVASGITAADVGDALVRFAPRPATTSEIALAHPGAFLDRLADFVNGGGGHLDPDTVAVPASYAAALLAAGAGLESVRRLDAGEGDAAFCAVRPPGHHATPTRSMGFCLINNVAVTARALAARGERVLIVDYDAHHGNGTQDVFYDDPRVTYVSFHEWPLYPGTGALDETGGHEARGTTINVPLPAGATGDVYLRGIDDLVDPFVESWRPTWVLVSAGFDAHRRDPLTGLALTAGDFADLTGALTGLVPAGRQILFLEGGYDLEGLAASAGAVLARLCGEDYRPEAPTSGGPGLHIVEAVQRRRHEAGLP